MPIQRTIFIVTKCTRNDARREGMDELTYFRIRFVDEPPYFRIRFVDEDKAIIESVEYIENKETENDEMLQN